MTKIQETYHALRRRLERFVGGPTAEEETDRLRRIAIEIDAHLCGTRATGKNGIYPDDVRDIARAYLDLTAND